MKTVKVRGPEPYSPENFNARSSIQYVLEELQTHIQLETANTTGKVLILENLAGVIKSLLLAQTHKELSGSVVELLNTITSLDQATADLLAGAEAQVAEFAEQLESCGTNKSVIHIADVNKELDRRQKMREKVAQIQEDLENQQDEMKQRLSLITQLLAHEGSEDEQKDENEKQRLETRVKAYEQTISEVIEGIATNDREVEILTNYRNAIQVVDKGLPADLIGKKLEVRSVSKA